MFTSYIWKQLISILDVRKIGFSRESLPINCVCFLVHDMCQHGKVLHTYHAAPDSCAICDTLILGYLPYEDKLRQSLGEIFFYFFNRFSPLTWLNPSRELAELLPLGERRTSLGLDEPFVEILKCDHSYKSEKCELPYEKI